MIIVRIILIFLITYLLLKGFIQSFYLEDKQDKPEQRKPSPAKKKISKNVGEYIDYEETK